MTIFFLKKKKKKKRLFPPGIEPGTFRVLGERDNRYTMETELVLLTPKSVLPYSWPSACMQLLTYVKLKGRGAPRKYETSPAPRFVTLRGR